MKVVIIGNGLAGTMAAKAIRELEGEVEVEVFAAETYAYYPRPNLIEFLAGRMSYDRTFAFSSDWQTRQKIAIHLGQPVVKISPDRRVVGLATGQEVAYDRLLLANGASAVIPLIKGTDKRGTFALRTLEDALRILDYLKSHPQVVVLGGGLLGLEIARALKTRGADVQIVEFLDRLLPRQLDSPAATILKSQLERMGLKVRLGAAAEEILGQQEVEGVRLKSGEKMEAQMAVVAAGAVPNLDIAADAGLATERGILVNDFLQTSDPHIYAAGDSVQHKGLVYGIIPACFDQARAAAYNILGLEKKYQGTVVSHTLKVAGLHLTSLGLVNPQEAGHEEIRMEIPELGVYKKIVVGDGILRGAIWLGTKQSVSEISRAVLMQRDVSRWRESLLEDTFDFSVLQ